MRACFGIVALLMFLAGQAWASRSRTDYAVTGSFHIIEDDSREDLQSCALFIGTNTTGRGEHVIVLTVESSSALAQFCRDHLGEHGRLTLAASPSFVETRSVRDGVRP